MASLRGFHSDLDGLPIPHLSDKNHFRSLPQGGAQAVSEAAGIAMQLTLVDNAILVRVKKLDWILNRENVIGMQFVDQINNRCQRRRLSRASWPCHQHNTIAQPSDIMQLHRQIQLLEGRNFAGNYPHHDDTSTALHEGIDAESRCSSQAVRDITRAVLA